MSEGGDELPPVVAALVGDDAAFLEMIARDVEAAQQFKGDLQEALNGTGTIEVSAEVGATDTAEAGDAIGAEIGSGIAEGAEEGVAQAEAAVDEGGAQIVATLAESSAEGGDVLEENLGRAAAAVGLRVEELQDQIKALGSEGTPEAVAAIQELNEELAEALAESTRLNEASFGVSGTWGEQRAGVTALADGAAEASEELEELQLELQGTRAALDEVSSAVVQVQGVIEGGFQAVESGAMSATEATEQFYAAMEAVNTVAGEQATAMKAALQVAGPSTALDTLKQVAVTYSAAATAADQYGTSEAQLSLTTQLLTNAQAQLEDENAQLVQSFLILGNAAGDVDAAAFATLQAQFEAFTSAQADLASSTQAQIDAMTQVNLAAIQNETAFMDETSALDGMREASIQLGLGLNEVADQLRAGTYALTDTAAAEAQAAIRSNLLTEAQQQLAAANLTLIQTYAELDAGVEVSSQAQMAALAGVKSAQGDVVSLGGSLSSAAGDAEGTAGGLGDLESAASGASKEMGGLSSIMYGPLGMALYPLMMVLPELGNLFKSNSVSASEFTASVTQDSGAVGDNTAATIQSTLAKSNLSAISNTLGLSQAQLIEYAAGEKNVQDQVTAAYDAKMQAEEKEQEQQQRGTSVSKDGQAATQHQSAALYAQKQALDAVAASVASAIQQDAANSAALYAAEQTTQIYNASVDALGESMLTQTEQTQMSNQATIEFGNQLLTVESSAKYMAAAVGAAGVNMELAAQGTEVTNEATVQYGAVVMGAYRDATMFNAAIDASYISMQEQAQTSAIASVGLLNLGDSQSSLNRQLVDGEMSYTQATSGASAYSSVLNSLNGTALTAAQAQNTLDGDMVTAKTTFDQNSDSLKNNTQAGVDDREALVSASQAIVAMGVAQYQSTGSMNQANETIAQQIDAYVKATGATGQAKVAIEQYLDNITKIPPNVATTVTANTQPAQSAVQSLIGQIDSSWATVEVNVGGSNSGHILAPTARASGGPVQQGQLYHVNESGAEGFFVPPANGYIVPHDQMASVAGSGGGGGSYGGGGSGGDGMPPIHVTVLVDGKEIAAVVTPTIRGNVQQYKSRNSQTGFN